jgi:hypothetical protein
LRALKAIAGIGGKESIKALESIAFKCDDSIASEARRMVAEMEPEKKTPTAEILPLPEGAMS